jgi:hypothetical protein
VLWIAVIAGVLVLVAAIYTYLALTCFFTEVTFMAAYRLEHDKSHSHEAALRHGMGVFRGRAPFNTLSDQDMDRVLAVFSLVPEPRAVAQIWRHIDRKRDAHHLRDEQYLSRLEAVYRESRVQP